MLITDWNILKHCLIQNNTLSSVINEHREINEQFCLRCLVMFMCTNDSIIATLLSEISLSNSRWITRHIARKPRSHSLRKTRLKKRSRMWFKFTLSLIQKVTYSEGLVKKKIRRMKFKLTLSVPMFQEVTYAELYLTRSSTDLLRKEETPPSLYAQIDCKKSPSVREIVTVRTPLMSNGQESCV